MPLPAFFTRPAHTIFYISETHTYRADLDRKGVIQGEITLIECACKSANALPTALETLLAANQPKAGRKVWLLYTRLPTHLLSLPAVQVEGVEPEILEQALQFEYEGMTGHSAGKSFLSHQYIGTADDMASYWITLIAQETLNKIKEILGKNHCRYGGLGHTGGLPLLISGDDVPSWLRVEYWPNVVLMLAKTPELGLAMQILNIKQNPDWQAEVDQWVLEIGEVDKSEALLNDNHEYLLPTDNSYRLSQEGAMVFWLGLWAQHLVASDDIKVPLLNPQKRLNKEIVYMVSGGLAAAFLCAAHFSVNLYFKNDFEAKAEQLSRLQNQNTALNKSLNTVRDQVDKLDKEVRLIEKNVNLIPVALEALQNRPLLLLKTLAMHSPENLVIEKITTDHDQLTISGYALEPFLINQLTEAIADDLQSIGWQMAPATKTAMAMFSNNGPWQFTLVLTDLGLEGFINHQRKNKS
jgi:hypothetical protein